MSSDPEPSVTRPQPSRTDVTYAEFEWDDVEPVVAVTRLLADWTGRQMDDIGPLHEDVDPDALNSLVRDHPWCSPDLKVTFRAAEWVVTVDSDGAVRIRTGE